jgi:hypothetical protein
VIRARRLRGAALTKLYRERRGVLVAAFQSEREEETPRLSGAKERSEGLRPSERSREEETPTRLKQRRIDARPQA